jgi:hypothetical protein
LIACWTSTFQSPEGLETRDGKSRDQKCMNMIKLKWYKTLPSPPPGNTLFSLKMVSVIYRGKDTTIFKVINLTKIFKNICDDGLEGELLCKNISLKMQKEFRFS